MSPDTYTTTTTAAGAGMSMGIMLLYFAIIAVMIAAYWKIFTKAGKPGWASIIPIYNIYTLLQIVQKPVWWLILFFIPVVNVITAIIVMLNLGKAFGKSTGWSVIFLVIFSSLGMLMLGFGSSTYQLGGAPSNKPTTPATPTPQDASAPPA